ncbi:uncharacterized protein F4812DRAFT_21467 [Daldinia caldariorum]|uniref:uncharacterized protein n=1 Tax=Daldinia caldariorum TaxID=326644 RepID=UPI002007ECD3|nr:uncharacterized protein F4812DRAFT_21467 [Daldinia caldariorum]KAI1472691.1 hypothetical protein F4812DRAFT_21467 [Daldinia caldariorum]
MELDRTITPSGKGHDQYHAQVTRRRKNRQGIIENPLAYLTDEELQHDVYIFWMNCLSAVDQEELLRAARVAQNARSYDEVARSEDPTAGYHLPVQLSEDEKKALIAEKDALFSQRKMFTVILAVSLAAFLQGFVQSSINGASLYAAEFGLPNVTSTKPDSTTSDGDSSPQLDDWKLGATNASPFFFAALLGCWLSLPLNDLIGRRGAIAVAACLIFASSLGSAWCSTWQALLCVRIVNGIGMGLKACSTPILAAETAVGFWRGSFILAWQLWVAFGIMVGFAFNLIFYTANDAKRSLQLILGAPFVPSTFLMIALWFCPESPRYYMRQRTSSYDPQKAYNILLRLRKTKLQALRDTYLVYKSIQLEEYSDSNLEDSTDDVPRGLVTRLKSYLIQYKELFIQRRLRNALISSSIVSLAQQLCGMNILAFYSGTLFSGLLKNSNDAFMPMVYSLGIGAVNFIFGLPAIRTIDTLGRRKWLVMTLPIMCLLMMAAALSTLTVGQNARVGLIAFFIFLFAAVYSPGMGPIPFTLASESFPLSHREAGCAFAITTNLLFAGLIQMFFPSNSIYARLHNGGSLGLFSGLNLLAFVLVFLFVEETKRRSLEDLDLVFAVRKRDFVRHQVARYLPWFFRRYVLGRDEDKPSLYVDLIWNGPRTTTATHVGSPDGDGDVEMAEGLRRRSGNGGGDGDGDGERGIPIVSGWNGFAPSSNGSYAGEENVSPSFLRRPSALVVLPDYLSARSSEDSNNSAHR